MNTEQDGLRGDGRLQVILAEGDTIAHAIRDAVIKCYKLGNRVETPKQKPQMTLGYDADIIVKVNHPEKAPQIYSPTMWDGPETLMQYILEVTHGLHDHWKKSPEHPDRWGYTYHERFVNQLPFVFARIKHDWDKRERITGRDYQFTTWVAGEDIVLEQEDPPCFQIGHLRFLQNKNKGWVLNYCTDWRSRCEFKAWNSNVISQVELMKLMANKVSDMLGIPVELGVYSDRSRSLHLYGLYFEQDKIGKTIEETIIPNKDPERNFRDLEDYFYDRTYLKRFVAAQTDADDKGYGKQLQEDGLKRHGYDIANFPYPSEWDSRPKTWDVEPDPNKLARIYTNEMIIERGRKLGGYFDNDEIRKIAKELGGIYSPDEILKMADEVKAWRATRTKQMKEDPSHYMGDKPIE